MTSIRTLVIGASLKPERFSNKAIQSLTMRGFETCAMGLREGEVAGVRFEKPFHPFENIHTITLYLGPANQVPYEDFILGLKPERVIFNPGTENPVFEERLRGAGIRVVRDCTLVMLTNGYY